MFYLVSLAAGLLFGTGLLLSGMADPGKVVAFLDFAGNWDPSLAFVMGGAIGVGLIAFTRAKKMSCSWLDAPMQWPSAKHIDWRLLAGSSLFGIGWGLAGVCPGPALVGIAGGLPQAWVFMAATLAGMGLYGLFNRLFAKKS